MSPLLVTYPRIDPVLLHFGPFSIRWYALAYIAGIVGGWALARVLVGRPALWGARAHPSVPSIDDLVVYVAIGIIAGGRLGYILFYDLPLYLAHPLQMLVVWKGGMAFHGGLIGTAIGMVLFARHHALAIDSVTDTVAPVVPIGLFLGRIANFIKPELWGRSTDVPWAMRFPLPLPDGDPCLQSCAYTDPRHPSQLYEAGLEGIALFVLLWIVIRFGGLRRGGLVTGLFCFGYGLARTVVEQFREPDKQIGFLWQGATMGQVLSAPLLLLGVVLIVRAYARPPADAAPLPQAQPIEA